MRVTALGLCVCVSVCLDYSRTTGYEAAYKRYQELMSCPNTTLFQNGIFKPKLDRNIFSIFPSDQLNVTCAQTGSVRIVCISDRHLFMSRKPHTHLHNLWPIDIGGTFSLYHWIGHYVGINIVHLDPELDIYQESYILSKTSIIFCDHSWQV